MILLSRMGHLPVVLLVLAALVGPVPAAAQVETNLRGKMFIAGKTVVDPPPSEARNTHAYVTITGAAAARMYRTMRARVRANECRGDGWKMKTAGPLICSVSRDGKRAECDFSISLVNGRSGDGRAC